MRNERGFTLAELLVATAVIGLVLAGVVTVQRQGLFAYTMGAGRVEAQQNVRFALEMMTRELRMARTMTTTASCNTGAQDITFETWDDANNAWVAVRYRVNGANLERTYGGVMTVLVAGVQSVSFRCYQSDGTTATATAANVRSIVVTIRTAPEDAPASSSAFQQAVAESRVRLRNLL